MIQQLFLKKAEEQFQVHKAKPGEECTVLCRRMRLGMRREESDHIVVVNCADLVVSPVEDEELRCRVCLAWKWTKSWIGEPHHLSARGLSRRDFLDCRPQLVIRERSGVVHCDLAGAIEQH